MCIRDRPLVVSALNTDVAFACWILKAVVVLDAFLKSEEPVAVKVPATLMVLEAVIAPVTPRVLDAVMPPVTAKVLAAVTAPVTAKVLALVTAPVTANVPPMVALLATATVPVALMPNNIALRSLLTCNRSAVWPAVP